eukprot:Nitzschia sp. Nitz4//scaffold187_size43274//3870//4809//NITZ4_007328-RA/size43274-processed-gene-0.67-mRNA-1//1//CDS//3329539792//4905//frame0
MVPSNGGKRSRGLAEEESDDADSHPLKPPTRLSSIHAASLGSSEASVVPVEEVSKCNLKKPPPSAPTAPGTTATTAPTASKKPPQPSNTPPALGSSEVSLASVPVSVVNVPNCAQPTRHRVIISNVPSMVPSEHVGALTATANTNRGSMDAVYHGRTNRHDRIPPTITTTNPTPGRRTLAHVSPLEPDYPQIILAALNAVAQEDDGAATTMEHPQATRPDPHRGVPCAPMAPAQLHPIQESESEIFVTAIPINVDPTSGAGEMSRQQRQERDLMDRTVQQQLSRKRRQAVLSWESSSEGSWERY